MFLFLHFQGVHSVLLVLVVWDFWDYVTSKSNDRTLEFVVDVKIVFMRVSSLTVLNILIASAIKCHTVGQ